MEKINSIVVLLPATILLLSGFLCLLSDGIKAPEFVIENSEKLFPSERHNRKASISSLWNERLAGVRNIKISLLGDSTAFRTTNGK